MRTSPPTAAGLLDFSGEGSPVVSFRFASPTLALPTVVLRPEVRVVASYRTETEQGMLPVGSGFFIDGWSQQLITAAHVVAPPAGALLTDVKVEVRWAGHRQWLRACSVAYRRDWARADMAVVCLGAPVAGVSPAWQLATIDESGIFSGMLRGYQATATESLLVVPVRAELVSGFLVYVSGRGKPGMSGGPLEIDGMVVGAHKGNVLIDGVKRPCSTAVRSELLFELQDRAVERCGEP